MSTDIVWLGLGGTFEKAALIAKKALLRPLGSKNPDPLLEDLENDLLERINRLGNARWVWAVKQRPWRFMSTPIPLILPASHPR